MLSTMRFCRAVEIAACGMSSGCSTAGRKHVTERYSHALFRRETHEVESTWRRMQTNQQQAGAKVDGKKVKHGGVA